MRYLLLSVLLSGCADAYDGTWLITATLTDDSCNPDSDYIGTDSQMFVNTFTTGAGTFGASVGGTVLTGVRTGTEFELGWEFGTSSSDSFCDTIGTLQQYAMEGSFSSDGGMDADLDSSERAIYDDCEDSENESDEECQVSYSLEGIRLHADPEQHPFLGVQGLY